VNRTYDLFEKMPNGEILWRGSGSDLEAGRRKLAELAEHNGNEYPLMHVLTHEVVERVKESPEE
jgi:hypothetical protein